MIESRVKTNTLLLKKFFRCSVWMLQCFYGATTTALFRGPSDWYAPVRYLDKSHDRYSFLFRKLGADAPEITVNAVLNDNEQDETAEIVWGSFNQHNDIVSKLEQHVGSIAKRFLSQNVTDVTIDDDKLRHTSKTFSDHGLQRTGFRGSRCGTVMNGAGSVQHGLIMAIYFSRKGDSALSTADPFSFFGIWGGKLFAGTT
jgi:hypothetical protein